MLFNHDSGLIQSILTIDTTVAPALGGRDTLQIIGTGGLVLPVGTTAERPAAPVKGLQRFNSTINGLEYFDGSAWVAGADGTVKSITVTADGSALSVNGGLTATVTETGTLALALDQTLVNLAASSPSASGGPVVRLADDTFVSREFVGTAPVTVVNGDGVEGNPTISVNAELTGLSTQSGVGYVYRTGAGAYVEKTLAVSGDLTLDMVGDVATFGYTASGDLAALTSVVAPGYIVKTAEGVYAARTLTGTTDLTTGSIVVTNGDGTVASPSISFTPGTELAGVASLATTGVVARTAAGVYSGHNIVGTGSIVVTNGDGALAGDITISYTAGANLGALDAMTGTGLMVRTGANTYSNVAVTGTEGNIDVANGDGIAGAPTVNLATVLQDTTAAGKVFSKVALDNFGRVVGNTPVLTADITALVDDVYLNVAGDTMAGAINMGGFAITNVGAPTNGADATTKNYVDALAAGLSWKQAAKAATVDNIALDGSVTVVDGVTVSAGDRILVRAQTAGVENGIYIVGTPWARAEDLDSPQESRASTLFVEQGATLADSAWTQTAEVVTIGTTPMTFVQFAGAGAFAAGAGLTLVGNTFSISAPVSTSLGGTGLTAVGTAGQVLAAGEAGLEYKTVTAGSGVSVTNAAGMLTIANTGVLSNVAGTGISIDSATGISTITNTGVLSVAVAEGSTGLTSDTVAGVVTLTSTAVTSVAVSGSGITASAPVAGVVTIANTGITSASAGAGISAITTDGALAISNTGVLSLVQGTGVTLAGSNDAITVTNNGVVDLIGTANQVSVSGAAGGQFTVGLPASVTVDTALTVSALGADKVLRTGLAGVVEGVALLDGQFLIGATGAAPAAGTIAAGTGVTVTNTANGIEIAVSGGAAINTIAQTVAAGSATALEITSGGTATAPTFEFAVDAGLESLAALATVGIVVQSAADTFVTRALVAGTGVDISGDLATGDLTIANTGVTSVALELPSMFAVAGSPVTTTGTLSATLASQAQATVFAAPAVGAGAPSFRALVPSDLGLNLYKENSVAAVLPTATGANAIALGSAADAPLAGQVAHAAGQFAVAGDAQSIELVLRGTTVDATTGELFLDGAALQAALPANSAWNFTVQVIGRRTDAAGAAAYRFDGIIVKDAAASSTAFIGVPSKNILGETQEAWDAAVVADATNGALKVTATGQAAASIKWVATIRATQVIG